MTYKTHPYIENYLLIKTLYNYLQNKNYQFIFLNAIADKSLPTRTCDFEIGDYLPKLLANDYKNMMNKVTDLYVHALRHPYLFEDLIHPSQDGHLDWTKQCLIPLLCLILK